MAESSVAGSPGVPPASARPFMRAEVLKLEKQLKEGHIGQYTVYADEPPLRGGDGAYPSPLQYFFLSVGFCLLSQVAKNLAAMGIEARSVKATVEGRLQLEGSVEEGTSENGITSVTTKLEFDTDAPAEQIRELARRSERMCFVSQAIKNPTDMSLVVLLNEERVVG